MLFADDMINVYWHKRYDELNQGSVHILPDGNTISLNITYAYLRERINWI